MESLNPYSSGRVPSSSSCQDFLACNVFLITTLLSWFSMGYSLCRLCNISCWLLQYSDEDDQDPVAQKNSLWGIVGTILISYEALLSLTLCIGTGSFVYEIKGFFLLIFCINYPVFIIVHWVLGFFLTKCCEAQIRMKRTSPYNCFLFLINLVWRSLMYWCALHILFDPARVRTSSSSSSSSLNHNLTNAKSASISNNSNSSLPPESLAFATESELDNFNTSTFSTEYY